MGFAVVTTASGMTAFASTVLAPLQALVDFFAPWQVKPRAADAAATAEHPSVMDRTVSPGSHAGCSTDIARRASTTRLRVLRVAEPAQSRTCAGRMVISGRLADVCAELDRLAAMEDR